MSGSLGVFDAKAQFSQLIDRTEAGEEIVFTRHGRPVAKLGPVTARISAAEREAILKETAALRAEIAENGPPFDWEEIRAMRDEGGGERLRHRRVGGRCLVPGRRAERRRQ